MPLNRTGNRVLPVFGLNKMVIKNIHPVVRSLLTFALLAGCVSVPESPTVTTLPSATSTSTAIPPTATPVETEFVANKLEDISGMWSFSYMGNSYRIQFLANGTIRSGPSTEPKKYLHGTFKFDGDVFRVDEPTCGPGVYEAHLIQRDGQNYKLYFKLIEDSCRDRVNEMKKGYQWVGP